MTEQESKNSDSHQDGEAFVKLLMEHEPQVRGFLRSLLPTWNDVDEVIQEASLIAWRKFGDFEKGTAFGGWFLTIARFEALQHRRKMSKTPLVFDKDVWALIAEEDGADHDLQLRRRHLEACLKELQPSQRAVLIQAHAPGVVLKEMAQHCGKSEQAFYKTVQRLRSSILACISRSIELENAQ